MISLNHARGAGKRERPTAFEEFFGCFRESGVLTGSVETRLLVRSFGHSTEPSRNGRRDRVPAGGIRTSPPDNPLSAAPEDLVLTP